MRVLLLAYLATLALFEVPCECQDVTPQVTTVDEDVDVVFSENEDIDVGRLLGDLLAGEENKESEQKKNEEDVDDIMITDKEAVAKRNKFMDSFLTRLSDTMRQSHDPMKLIFKKSGKVLLRQEGKKERKGATGDEKSKKKRKWRRRFRKRGNKGKKKMRERHPKSLAAKGEEDKEDIPHDKDGSELSESLNELTYEDEESEATTQQEKRTNLTADNDYSEDEELLDYDDTEGDENLVNDDPEGRFLDTQINGEDGDYEDDASDLESPRDGRELAEASEDGKSVSTEGVTSPENSRARHRRRRKKGGQGKCGKVCRRRRRIRRRRKNQKRRKAGKDTRGKRLVSKPTALVTGISVIRRSGDVRIEKEGQKENVAAELEVGPIVLRAERAFQTESNEEIRTAEAKALVVKGELILTLSSDGVSLKSLDLIRPEVIKVNGSLARTPSASSGRFMKTYLPKTQPLIVHKLKKTANKLLKHSNNNAEFLKTTTA